MLFLFLDKEIYLLMQFPRMMNVHWLFCWASEFEDCDSFQMRKVLGSASCYLKTQCIGSSCDEELSYHSLYQCTSLQGCRALQGMHIKARTLDPARRSCNYDSAFGSVHLDCMRICGK